MRSVLQDDAGRCFLCDAPATEKHHVFGGAMRSKSEEYGLFVHLCHNCHNEPPNGVHHNRERMAFLHKYAQSMAMVIYSWSEEDFRKKFYKNYL